MHSGCGFGNFNVHLPSGRPRASSSVSSMSASASASQNSTDKNRSGSQIVRNDTSILEKYEMHVSASENYEKI
ncbi:MAG: activator of HSP90 ATPase [Bacillariaceae sp.]|jgi:activator of HSP90 ATPase